MHYNKHFLQDKRTDLNKETVDQLIRHALVEDIGKGDITTQLTIPENKDIKAHLLAKEDCVVCGIDIAGRTFELVDKNIDFKAFCREGQKVAKNKILAVVSGKARSILNAERVALNMLTLLSGIATKTRTYVDRVEPLKVKITDTRKTMPGLRELQKYAVRVGGGYNHRISLDEMILIKDNHIKITEGYNKLPKIPKGFKIEIETQNLDEFKHALQFKPDLIMLDNMPAHDIKQAVELRNSTDFTKSHHPKTKLEASGGITLENIREIAETGVDIISLGDLTHSVDAVDICLDVV
ncbi:MAG TPA: carboxylating nicotinate-nucleotide diphosphorylase [Candidatus Omnitrophota bacterium]|nr:carboxylating nicotinate-nucleotide diphosphorylase [Candidatus Omnitrophota bacterium]HQO38493.1 carboxylating nicotinate-nucleotide diphosphorylase [Candidatus Omnitrophota bacterium]HQQ06634.1 carboxylating nicotinate-nucleotide diphosphorylase [Candidatus Omnitrophota bacterium]